MVYRWSRVGCQCGTSTPLPIKVVSLPCVTVPTRINLKITGAWRGTLAWQDLDIIESRVTHVPITNHPFKHKLQRGYVHIIYDEHLLKIILLNSITSRTQ